MLVEEVEEDNLAPQVSKADGVAGKRRQRPVGCRSPFGEGFGPRLGDIVALRQMGGDGVQGQAGGVEHGVEGRQVALLILVHGIA